MADIHGIPDASMTVPEQSFMSVPLPDLTGSYPLQVSVPAGMLDDGEHIAAMSLPSELTGDMGPGELNLAPALKDDGSPEPS
ncbi:MAG TPA: hypothetical protein VGH57_16830 [Amycolatopsis sp.]|jgi:hypothetical protein